MKGYNKIVGMMYDTQLSFVSTWKTDNTSAGSSNTNQVKLPLVSGGTYNFIINWGDGTSDIITTWNQAQVTHTYASIGTHTITITGICTGWQFNNTGDRLKILSVANWGSLRLGNNTNYFYGCSNLTLNTVNDIIIFGTTTNLTGLFRGCTSIINVNRINEWDISSITNISFVFANTSFNQSLNNWNTGNVTTMASMFSGATSFNQNLGSWVVSSVTTFSSMFFGAISFNNGGSPDINNWVLKTSAPVILSSMFRSCISFNQPLNNWNTSAVTDFSLMFFVANIFNQNIGSWNTSSATTMATMFGGVITFNQNLGSWNVSNVTNFSDFMSSKTPSTFSASNLDAIYNGWSSRPVKTPITISFGTAKYTAASSAGKAILTSAPNNWVITDGGI